MNRQQETECLSYFRGSGIWDRILAGFWDKYSSYEHFGGRVLLRSLSAEDIEVLEGFFGKSFHGQKSVTVSAESFQRALEKSRFAGIQPERLLELYFHKKPKGKREIRQEEERKQAEILQELKAYCQGTPAENQLEVIKAILSTGRNKGTEEWRRLLFLGARMVNALPCHRGEYLYLAVFAAQLTGNPHAFDAGTIEGNLLRQLVKVLSEKEKKSDPGIFPAFEKQQEYLDAIQNKSVRIGNLINLLFEYVKLDSEGFALNGKTLDLCELLRENAAMLYAEMEENGMTLTADIPEETIPVWADELQLSRVVTNLLTNAMQHNPKGTRIGLFAYRELERIYVLVADSGILIPEEQAQHLFDPFTRGDKARVSDGRNGLGLSIVSKIVQMHGWDLKLVQQPQIQHYAKAAGFAKAFVIRMENAGMYSVHSPK